MANLQLNHLTHISSMDARLADDMRRIQDAINAIALQTNANPVGTKIDPPNKINSVSVAQSSPGVAKVTVTDNSPARRGIWYHLEASSGNFEVGNTSLLATQQSRVFLVPVGGGALNYRAYSQYLTSDPSEPVTAGAAFDAGGSARTGDLSGTGSGTEPSIQPQPGAGFGFSSDRTPAGRL